VIQVRHAALPPGLRAVALEDGGVLIVLVSGADGIPASERAAAVRAAVAAARRCGIRQYDRLPDEQGQPLARLAAMRAAAFRAASAALSRRAGSTAGAIVAAAVLTVALQPLTGHGLQASPTAPHRQAKERVLPVPVVQVRRRRGGLGVVAGRGVRPAGPDLDRYSWLGGPAASSGRLAA